MQSGLVGPTAQHPLASVSRSSQFAAQAGGRLCVLSRGPTCAQQVQPPRQQLQRRRQTTCAANSPDSPGTGFGSRFRNRFGNKKEDDARKQLQDLFKDKTDMLALYDEPPGGGGKGGNGKGGGGGGGWEKFDWRDWGRSLWVWLRESLQGVASVVAAMALFAGVLMIAACGPPVLSFAVGLLRKVMRLGGSGRRRLQLQHTHSHDDGEDSDLEMGPYEQQMIAKYGPASVAPREITTAST